MAGRKEYEMLFQLNAQMGSNFSSTFTKAQQELISMQKEIDALSKIQSDISAYQKQQSAVEKTNKDLATLKQEYDNIQREIKETEGFSSSLENKLLRKQQQIDKTSDALSKQSSRLDTMSNALKEAGVDTDNLTKESAELSTKMGELKNKQEQTAQGASKFGNSFVDAIEAAKSALMAAGIAKLYQEIAEEMAECVKASIEFESAITGVFKTVDGTDAQLDNITRGIKDMSTEMPATTTEIAAVAEAAGQLGIATDDVLDFTKVMIDLGESTNLSADEAASSLAKFANITRTDADNYSRLGSVVVDLGNNFATTEKDIVAMSTRLASAGSIAGLSEPEIMALAAAMSSVGIEAEVGGTAMAQTLNAIETAVATNSAELAEFARISGVSAAEFSSAWNNSPIEAIETFITGLGSLDSKGESSVLVLEKLGLTGIRQSNMLKSLGLAAETMGDAIGTANKAWDENTALTIEASKRYATTESQLKMLQNSYGNLQVAIGDALTPALGGLSEVGSDVLGVVTQFISANPELIQGFTAMGIGAGAAGVALLGYVSITKLATEATKALKRTMETNPYLLAASAIIGLVTAVGSLAVMASSSQPKVEKLTATAEKQQAEIAQLEAEYKKLCDAGKESSEEAQYLKYQIDGLTDSFESQKQTLAEYIAECEELHRTWDNTSKENKNAVAEIDINSGRTQALITRLSELASQTDKTAASQEEMKTIVAELNELLPDVSFNYEDIKNGLGEFQALLENAEEAQAKLLQAQKARENMMSADKSRAAQKRHLEDTKKQLELETEINKKLKESYDAAYSAYSNWIAQGGRGTNPYEENKNNLKAELKSSNEALETYRNEITATEAEIEKFTGQYNEALKSIVETSGITVESIDAITALDETVATASLNMQSLAATYNTAYITAKESFEGQYGLFDQAQADMEATVSSAQRALDLQLNFWQTYADNINILRSVSAEDLDVTQENYNEIMAYAQSGTEEAAGFAQSLADAVNSGNTEAIANLANTVGEVKKAREQAAGEAAAWKVDFNGQMAEIVSSMKTYLEEMDMSEEAIAAATSTMNAYAESVSTQGSQAVANALAIANEVRAALQSANTTITVRVKKVEASDGGYASGTNYAMPGAHWVGENGPELLWFNGGEKVLDARASAQFAKEQQLAEMQIISFLPLMQNYLKASGTYTVAHTNEPTYAKTPASYNSKSIEIHNNITIEGNATEEAVLSLEKWSEDLREMIRDEVGEISENNRRSIYT